MVYGQKPFRIKDPSLMGKMDDSQGSLPKLQQDKGENGQKPPPLCHIT